LDRKKYIAVGDIHGCAATLKALLDKLGEHNDRSFIFVGDYIDRGPSSKEVVDYLLDFRNQADCIFLRGNHEQMMLDAMEGGDKHIWIRNGGRDTIDSYKEDGGQFHLPDEHLRFYKSTKFYFDTEDYFFVHAGLSPTETIEQSLKKDKAVQNFLWERSHLNIHDQPWEKKVIFGHTPRPQPVNEEKMIGIDTGCVYDRIGLGKLTAIKLHEEEFVQQNCID